MSAIEGFFNEVDKQGDALPEQATEVQPTPEVPVGTPAETPEPVVEPEPTPEAPKQEQTVPLSVFLRERDERKQIERRNAEMEERRHASAQPQGIPDPVDDPNGFAAAIQAQQYEALVAQRFQMSREIANQQHGAETVEAAREWAMQRAAQDPAFDLMLGQQAHPIDWIVRQHKRDGLLSQIGDDPDAWVRRRYAELNPAPATPAAAPAAMGQPAPTPPTPPRSLAAAPSSGGGVKDVPVGPLAAVESVFSGR